ncbi:Reticulocyte-binding protein 2-like protein a [Diplonema papillatum]|nr:Reticulocyte-binding protein 2-like protein a [Diplonema papillatum]KAJ9435804.1 Reticulocyte-binding protein 2-like protein a [Diplonema papillatum]KAJ9436265.1 Reticulocyte-binding protein 2-like protein a [Diplonema papillatum]KAJ9436419.1 Reticulocyte-binding protein 2-like protein a [Diplonema papillatum]KAJ9437037.1 Reticulocyte-binding protein 2-like protein a [Diplonema papillatum]
MSLYDIKALPEGTRREAATSLLQQLPWDAEVVALPRNGRVLVVRAAGAPPATEFKLREGGTCTIRPSPPPISRVPDPTARNKREKYTKKEFLDFCGREEGVRRWERGLQLEREWREQKGERTTAAPIRANTTWVDGNQTPASASAPASVAAARAAPEATSAPAPATATVPVPGQAAASPPRATQLAHLKKELAEMERRLTERVDRRLEEAIVHHAETLGTTQTAFLTDLQKLIGQQHEQQQKQQQEQTTRQQRWMAEQEQRQERQQQLQHEMLQQLVHLQRESRSEQEQQRVREQDLQGRQEQLVTAEEQERGRVQQEQQEQWDKHEQQHVRELQKRQQRDTNQPRPKVATKREASRSAEGTPAKAKLRLAQDSEDSSESPSVVDWATDGSDSEGAPPSTPSSCRGGRWEVGDMVEAQHTDDRWYEAALKGQAADGTWTVAYSNGVTQGGRLPEQMRQKI